jgi:hypothetical protein
MGHLTRSAAGRCLFNSSFSAPPHANLANTSIVHQAGRYLALYARAWPDRIDGNLTTPSAPSISAAGCPEACRPTYRSRDRRAALDCIQPAHRGHALCPCRHLRRLNRALPFCAPWPAMVHDPFPHRPVEALGPAPHLIHTASGAAEDHALDDQACEFGRIELRASKCTARSVSSSRDLTCQRRLARCRRHVTAPSSRRYRGTGW